MCDLAAFRAESYGAHLVSSIRTMAAAVPPPADSPSGSPGGQPLEGAGGLAEENELLRSRLAEFDQVGLHDTGAL